MNSDNLGILDTTTDPHVLSGALKLFFRELEESVIPWTSMDKLYEATNLKDRPKKINQYRHCLSEMPICHQYTLKFVLRHLLKINQYKSENKMEFMNIAIVFGPTLIFKPTLPDAVPDFRSAFDMSRQNAIIQDLLENYHDVYPENMCVIKLDELKMPSLDQTESTQNESLESPK